MRMDSETLELLTLWRGLPAESKARMLEKARYVALAAGLEKAPEFEPLFEQSAVDCSSEQYRDLQRLRSAVAWRRAVAPCRVQSALYPAALLATGCGRCTEQQCAN